MDNKTEEAVKDNRNEDEINIFNLIVIVLKWKKFIMGMTLSLAVITVVYSLTLPNIYEAEARILSFTQNNPGGLASRLARQLSNVQIDSSSISKINFETLVSILHTNTVYKYVVDILELGDEYKDLEEDDLMELVGGMIRVKKESDASSVILFTSRNRDPEEAAKFANAFVSALKKRLHELAITESSQKKLFLEEELKRARQKLIASEEEMIRFKEKTGFLMANSQVGGVINSIANLRSQVAAKEVELRVMQSYSTENNPDLQRVTEAITGLKLELNKIESKDADKQNHSLTMGSMPSDEEQFNMDSQLGANDGQSSLKLGY